MIAITVEEYAHAKCFPFGALQCFRSISSSLGTHDFVFLALLTITQKTTALISQNIVTICSIFWETVPNCHIGSRLFQLLRMKLTPCSDVLLEYDTSLGYPSCTLCALPSCSVSF